MDDSQSNGYHFSCLIILVLFAYLGGAGAHFATQGLNPDSDSVFRKLKLVPLFTLFIFPTLLAQLVWGALARNGLMEYFDDYYDDYWGKWIRSVGTAIILVRTGFELDFKNKGLHFINFAFVPGIMESIVVAIMGKFIFDLSWAFSFSLGFLFSAVSPAILVPGLLKLKEGNFGQKKGIPTLLLASAAFNISLATSVFSVCNTIGFNQASNGTTSLSSLIIGIIEQLFAGFGTALILSAPLMLLRGKHNYIKAAAIITILMIIMWFYTYVDLPIAGLLAQIFFGYGCKLAFEGKHPSLEVKYVWWLCMPFLFGHVGAQINMSKMGGNLMGYSTAICFVGMLVRGIFTYAVLTMDKEKQYTVKEKIFVVFAWIPKATVQASFAGTILTTIKGDATLTALLTDSGNAYLTTSILSVIFAAPLGALLIENLGPRLLTCDTENLDVTPISTLGRREKYGKFLKGGPGNIRSTDVSDVSFLQPQSDMENTVNVKNPKDELKQKLLISNIQEKEEGDSLE